MKKIFLVLLVSAIAICLPIFLHVGHTFPRLDTDYDSSLPVYAFIVNYTRVHHMLPSRVYVVPNGIPVLADPLNSFLNPLFGFPLLLFGVNMGVRASILLCCYLSGLTMFFLLKKLKIGKGLSLWGALLYMSGGAFVAAVASGHIEKFLVYPFVPLLFLFSLNKILSFKNILLLGGVIAITIYSGDLYNTWFFLLLLACIRSYYFITIPSSRVQQITVFFSPLLIFLGLASFKLVPFFQEVLPTMRRFSNTNPFDGSIQAFFFPLQFLMPLQVNFWDRPFFQRHFGFYFNWYEYYGFLGLFPILFLKNIRRVYTSTFVKIFLVLFLMASLYVSSGFFYSPFHWLLIFWHGATVFRVPQRIVLPMTAVVVAFLAILASSWKKTITRFLICAISLVWTLGISWFTLSYTFVAISPQSIADSAQVAKIDVHHLPIANFSAVPQVLLTQYHIPLVNYYYGWMPQGTGVYVKNGLWNYNALKTGKVAFVVAPVSVNISPFGYTSVFKNRRIQMWQRK